MKCIAQLGDVHPLDYGGAWVLMDDERGAEVECLEVPEDSDFRGKYIVHRFIVDKCTFINGILSDNSFHPSYPAWFAGGLEDVQRYSGAESLITSLCSEDPIIRARAYLDIASYYGLCEFDQYPLELTRREAVSRYRQSQYQEQSQ